MYTSQLQRGFDGELITSCAWQEIMNDPFFRDNADFGPEFAKAGKGSISKDGKQDKKAKGKKGKGNKETVEERKQRQELELLLVGMPSTHVFGYFCVYPHPMRSRGCVGTDVLRCL
jgi:hypothetical protein